ncbi:ABC transporter substrate-binding protein [Microbacterium sp. DT81.1]|uniref:ABC transporter substrate-binding protein n=1 Tax=Microbacterium sp. DT81.1 TaxID=3393413 RepID=UPI003CF9BEE4
MTSQRRLTKVGALAAAAAMTVGVSACAGGGGDAGSSSGDEPLVVMSTFTPADFAGPWYEAAVEAFTEETGIEVKSVTVSAVDIYTAYETAVLAGEEPDVLIANLYDKALTWTETGATLPVNDYLKEWGLDKTIESAAIDDWTDADGNVQAFPFNGFTWPVWYNTEILSSVGIDSVPTTYDELIEAATALNGAGIAPVAIGGSDWSGMKFFLQLVQLTMSEDEAKDVMSNGGYCDSEAAMTGIEDFLALSEAGVFIKDAQGLTADNMYAEFNQGTAAIMPAGSWQFSATPEELIPNVTLGGFPLPNDSSFDKPVAYQAFTSSGVWVTKKSADRLEDYRKFVEFMYSADVQSSLVSDAGVVPVVEVPGLEDALADQPLLLNAVTEMPDTVEYGVFPDFFVPGAKTQAINSAISTAYAPGAEAADVCAAIDAAYN